MKKIKLDPFTIALIVLVLLIVFTLVGNYFDSAKSRVSELEKQIQRDLNLLKLTKQKHEELAEKAVTVYRIVISAVFLLFITLISATVFTGLSYIDALEVHLGTAGIMIAAVTTFFYQTWNPDVLLKVLRDRIKNWVYKKNGYDPTMIELLKSRVNISQLELESTRVQIVQNSE